MSHFVWALTRVYEWFYGRRTWIGTRLSWLKYLLAFWDIDSIFPALLTSLNDFFSWDYAPEWHIWACSLIWEQEAERWVIKPLVALYFAEIKEEPETVSWLPCDYQKLYAGRAEKDQGIRCSHLLPLNPTNLPLETETNPCKRSSLSSKEAIKGENLLIFSFFLPLTFP